MAIFAHRFYFSSTNINNSDQSLIFDIRDKHDLFGKVAKERRNLNSKNSLQVKTLQYKFGENNKKYYFGIGRHVVKNTGGKIIDGFEIKKKQSRRFDFSLFAGYNPQTYGESELKWNSHKIVTGITSHWAPNKNTWGKNNFITNALILEEIENSSNRVYLQNSFLLNNQENSIFQGVSFLDLTPTLYIQNIWLSYLFFKSRFTRYSISITSVDQVLQTKQSDVFDNLDASRYSEITTKISSRIRASHNSLTTRFRYGKRQSDNKEKLEATSGINIPSLILKSDLSNFKLGIRNNFDYKEALLSFSTIIPTNSFEFFLDQDIIVRRYKNSKIITPIVSELGLTYMTSKSLFLTTSVQYAKDDKVNIFSLFFKLVYRFGNKATTPLRNGKVRKGRL